MNETSSIQVIDRMVAVLDALASVDKASLKQLAGMTGLHPSTAHRILAAVAAHGWVVRSADGGYQLGSGLSRYARRTDQQDRLRQLALPLMAALRDQTGETVNLVMRDGDEVVYTERAVSRQMMRVEQMIGSRAPLHVTAVGKLMLADAGREACMAYAERTGLPGFTVHTLTSPTLLWQDASRALVRGYAFDNEEAESGIGCIAVLVRDGEGRVLAGLSISAPRERRRDEWAGNLLEVAGRLSGQMG